MEVKVQGKLGKTLPKKVSQFGYADFQPMSDRHVPDKSLVPRCVLASDDDGFADRRVFGQESFDLPQFDAMTANLHLLIDTSEEFQVAVWQISRQIASTINARTRFM